VWVTLKWWTATLTVDISDCTGKAIKGSREKYVIATKFGNKRLSDGSRVVDGSPKYVQEACEASLKRLQIDYIDLYYQHRVDRQVGIETTVREMKVMVLFKCNFVLNLKCATLHWACLHMHYIV